MAQPKSAAAARRPTAPEVERTYFIVNPAGAIHEVTREHATMRLKQVGFRLATRDEVAELNKRGGNQRWDRPICQPWSPDPDVEPDLPDQPEE